MPIRVEEGASAILDSVRDIAPARMLMLRHVGASNGVRDPLIAQRCCKPFKDFCGASRACSSGEIEFRGSIAKFIEIIGAAREPSHSLNHADRIREIPL
jgi:hypothetical protein